MSPALARPLLHTLHLLTFTLLLITGALMLFPELRSAFTGGYSLVIRRAHLWGGIAFAALPAVVVPFGGSSVFMPPGERTLRTLWQGSHVTVTILMGILFTLTGIAIWKEGLVSESLADASRTAHDWLTYAAAALVGVHLIEVGASNLVARVRTAGTVTGSREGS